MGNNFNGELFLEVLYKNLTTSEEVEKASREEDRTSKEGIRSYLRLLERLLSGARDPKRNDGDKYNRLELLKKLYYDKYIPNGTDEQKKSLGAWLDYLTSEDARYPMWAKYWIFREVLKLGVYDPMTDSYTKRTKTTNAPFVEVNPEIIAKCVEKVVRILGNKALSKQEVNNRIGNVSFEKMYIEYYKLFKKRNVSSNDGIWVKYNQGSEEEARRLSQSLNGHNTGWCTASESMAINQVCGGGGYRGGDFYVFYTKDEHGEYKIPRIAIRMDGKTRIGEIRGILESQALEIELVDILEAKLKEIPNVDQDDIDEKISIVNGLRNLYTIMQKTRRNEQLSNQEIIDLYTRRFGFGWHQDPLVGKIIERRDKSADFRNYDVALAVVQQNINALQYIPEYIVGYQKIVKIAVQQNPYALQFLPKELINRKLAMVAVQRYGFALQFLPKELINREMAMIAVQENGLALQYVPKELIDREMAMIAVQQNSNALYYVPKELINHEMAMMAVQQNSDALKYVPSDIEGYKEIAIVAVQQYILAIEFVPTNIEGYKEIAIATVKKDGYALQYIPKELIDQEIAMAAVQQNIFSLQYVPEDIEGYEKIAMIAVQQSGYALQCVPKELINREIAITAVQQDSYALKFVPKELIDREMAMMAVQNDNYALIYVPRDIEGYEEIAMIAQQRKIQESDLDIDDSEKRKK